MQGLRALGDLGAEDAMTGPRYETAYEQQQRTGRTDSVVCMDCGAFVMNMAAHDRFHSSLVAQGESLTP